VNGASGGLAAARAEAARLQREVARLDTEVEVLAEANAAAQGRLDAVIQEAHRQQAALAGGVAGRVLERDREALAATGLAAGTVRTRVAQLEATQAQAVALRRRLDGQAAAIGGRWWPPPRCAPGGWARGLRRHAGAVPAGGRGGQGRAGPGQQAVPVGRDRARVVRLLGAGPLGLRPGRGTAAPHRAGTVRAGPPVVGGGLRPGDLAFWATDPTDPSTIHHVGTYVGQGLMVHAPYTGALVRSTRCGRAATRARPGRPAGRRGGA
jgi:cell wall-associated NlpC family hydrolase